MVRLQYAGVPARIVLPRRLMLVATPVAATVEIVVRRAGTSSAWPWRSLTRLALALADPPGPSAR
ncbi:hypothetical protein [Pseudonocardia parietis]|uniref:Uncharacterized protein n=1 Tax=Pseudonocardia parietis TaxID=570936 RepID=A0ABS4VZN0_9PSEU|nr:hypothetical protein [Pseudonocardia parietis]MBP2369375.1 hypothetical protein [Pseudonocardia parietis]